MIYLIKSFFYKGHAVKSHKDDSEKHKTKKTVQSNCVGASKKEKLHSDSKKHNESNSMLFIFILDCKMLLKISVFFRY